MTEKKKVVISSDSHMLKETSRELIDRLREMGVIDEIVFDVHVSFEEALRNAMLHGNKLNPVKTVAVETEITDEELMITIEDQGQGFDPAAVPDPTAEENLLRESGRGVYLIKYLMDEVHYTNGGRKVVMKKYLKKKQNMED
jgi:serine/threonine-protein kinase RsbW